MANRNHRKRQLAETQTQERASTSVSTLYEAHVDAQVAAIEEFEEELWSETSRCEQLTAESIRKAEPTQKLSAFDSGVKEWSRALCGSATRYYKTCFDLALRNTTDLGEKKPADFAYDATVKELSFFLRVNALDGKEEKPDGLVREFILHVCGDWSGVLGDSASTSVFQLPSWAARRSLGARIAGWPIPPRDAPLSPEYAEWFILGAEATLTAGLRDGLSKARRKAFIATGMENPSFSQEPQQQADRTTTEAPKRAASENRNANLLMVTFVKLKSGLFVAQKPFDNTALLSTYDVFSSILDRVRVFIRANRGKVSAKQLKDNFGKTELGKVATEETWEAWIVDFSKENATSKNIALVFLETTTGLKRKTLKSRFAAARKELRMKTPPSTEH